MVGWGPPGPGAGLAAVVGAAATSATTSSIEVDVFYVLGLVLLAVVVWAVVDVARRPTSVLPGAKKAAWIGGMVAGTLVVGIAGPVVAGIYLAIVRPRLQRVPLKGGPPDLAPTDSWE